jgi:hypothetical protein
MARAPPVVPARRAFHGSPASVKICHIATRATSVPAIGVHSPGISRSPDPTRHADASVVTLTGGAPHSVELARTTSAEPTTSRMSSKPAPGQPVANVEYRRRNQDLPTVLVSAVATPDQNPRKGRARHPFELAAFPEERPARRVPCGNSRRLEARTMCDSTQPGRRINSVDSSGSTGLAWSHGVSPGTHRWHAPCPQLSRGVSF